MSQETRTLIAAALALAVIVAFSFLYKPQLPPNPPPQQTSPVAPQTPPNNRSRNPPQSARKSPALSRRHGVPAPVHVATAEKLVEIDTPVSRIELSNRGAIVQSWLLTKYTDDSKPAHTLDVVHPDAAKLSGWPMSIVLEDPKLEAAANSGLYEIKTGTGANAGEHTTLQVPAQVEFSWSDGHLEVTKKLKFDSTYIAELSAEVKLDGHDIPFSIAWRGGFGDATAYHASLSTYVFYSQAGKVEQLNYKNVGQPKQPDAPGKLQPGPLDFVGIDDTYFAAAFLPPLQQTGALAGQPATLDADLSLTDWSVARDFVGADGKTDKDFVPQMAAGAVAVGRLMCDSWWPQGSRRSENRSSAAE